MEIFNQVLFWINNVLITLCGFAFGIQLLYVIFFFLPAKKYKPAEKKHRFGIIIPARNEEAVIGETVKCLLRQDYPRELFDVFVVADNCTDNTAEIARKAGATVFEHFDDDPKHKRAGYALKYGFEKILENYDNYEAFIKFDADNLMEPDYISKMNDAFDSGVKSARGYSNSKNLTQNMISGISGLWYIRDCRFSCQVRSFLNTSQMLGGAGMMFSAEIIKKYGGWDCLSQSDDAEFSMNRLIKDKIKTKYVSDAIVYEDQPTTLKDTFNRYKRMGSGLNKLFYTHGIPAFLRFFTRFSYSCLDMFLNLLFIPIAVVCCLWMPLYYGYDVVYHFIIGQSAYSINALINIGYILAFAFVVPFILQALLAAILERKKIKSRFRDVLPHIFAFPCFMIVYAIAITLGVFSKPKWAAVKRNVAAPVGLELAEAAATADTPMPASKDSAPLNDPSDDGFADLDKTALNETAEHETAEVSEEACAIDSEEDVSFVTAVKECSSPQSQGENKHQLKENETSSNEPGK